MASILLVGSLLTSAVTDDTQMRPGTPEAMKRQSTPPAGSNAKKGESPRDPRFVPVTAWERFFVVRFRNENIGVARAELQIWHNGLTQVHEFERHLFKWPSELGDTYFWDIERHSESQGNTIRMWGNGRNGGVNWNYRISGVNENTRVSRAWGGDVIDRKRETSPEGYILYDKLSSWLMRNRGRSDMELEHVVPAWYTTPTGWVTFIVRPEGQDDVQTMEGVTVQAWRFRVAVRGAPDRIYAYIWADREGRLVKKSLPFLGVTYEPCAKASTAEHGKYLDWDTAVKKFGFKSDGMLRDVFTRAVAKTQKSDDESKPESNQLFAASMALWEFGL